MNAPALPSVARPVAAAPAVAATPVATGFAGTLSEGVAKLDINGKSYELPLLVGTENERAVDISKLRAMTGVVTLDEGYVNTGSTTSAITFLDGEKANHAQAWIFPCVFFQ